MLASMAEKEFALNVNPPAKTTDEVRIRRETTTFVSFCNRNSHVKATGKDKDVQMSKSNEIVVESTRSSARL